MIEGHLSAAHQSHQTFFGLSPVLGSQSLQRRRGLSWQRFTQQPAELVGPAQLQLPQLLLHELLPSGGVLLSSSLLGSFPLTVSHKVFLPIVRLLVAVPPVTQL